ncbi:hypothetical protein CK203_068978 [Vitis vinifera]|uniref:Carbohydrate kinase PfkB domain-containing protein n=1 Tax=Vitis vinifera TaxID=29760 RepID=A0A438F158_VITVI|nr:hypothetical protein CK203_068978 [Vitis vinifera]
MEWTEAPSIASALVSMLLRLPKLKFVIVTLGEDGCIMLERSLNGIAYHMLHVLPSQGTQSHMHNFCKIKLILALEVYLGARIRQPFSMSAEMQFAAILSINIFRALEVGLLNEHDRSVTKVRANGIGTVNARLFVGTAEKIPPSEVIDTTGAGDAFIGAVLYAICTNMPPEKMLPFAAQVAAAGCRALGARTGLPHRTDPRLASFLH